jgi:hypothetical protein
MFSHHDWIDLIKHFCKSEPFQVVQMGKNDIVCFKPLTEKLCKRQKDINGEKVDFQAAGDSFHIKSTQKRTPSELNDFL